MALFEESAVSEVELHRICHGRRICVPNRAGKKGVQGHKDECKCRYQTSCHMKRTFAICATGARKILPNHL